LLSEPNLRRGRRPDGKRGRAQWPRVVSVNPASGETGNEDRYDPIDRLSKVSVNPASGEAGNNAEFRQKVAEVVVSVNPASEEAGNLTSSRPTAR